MEKFRKPAILIIAVVIGLALYSAFTNQPAPNEIAPESIVTTIDFEIATYEEKQAYIQNYLNNPDDAGYETVTNMRNLIKAKFNYPKTVDFTFGEDPILSRGRIVDADTGIVFIEGTGTSENAFKQESEFAYSVRLKITDKVISVEDVSVSEIN